MSDAVRNLWNLVLFFCGLILASPFATASDLPPRQERIQREVLGQINRLIENIEQERAPHCPAVAAKSRIVHRVAQAEEALEVVQIEQAAEVDILPAQVQTRPAPRTAPSTAPDKTGKDKPAPDSLEGILKRAHEVETEIARLKKQPAPQAPDKSQPVVILEHPHLSQGQYRSNNKYDRAFVVRLLIANPTGKDLQLKRAGVSLTADQETYKPISNNSNYHSSFSVGGQHYSVNSLKMPEAVKIPAGQSASTWVSFGEIPMNPAVPDMKLTLEIGGEKREIDVNEFCRARLKSSHVRIGPKDCLAVVTIAGQLNPINARFLVEQLDDLAVNQKVARVVIRWEKGAEPVERNLMGWLQQAAMQAGQVRGNNQNNNNQISYPTVSMSIRELHLAEIPQTNGRSTSSDAQSRIHKTSGEAIIAALRTAYQALPADDVVDDLRHQDPVIRAAALMGGGGQLPPDKLPVLMEFISSKNRNLQRSAVFAMRNFGEDEAIQTLVNLVKKNEKPLCTEAAESLATSRFAAASDALLELLETADADVKTNIVQVLAKYPRPAWAESIAEYAQHPETPIGMASLRALVRIGHPNLHRLLAKALEQDDESIQMEAFNILAGQKDPESERLAVEFMLKYLRTKPPAGQMMNLISRTKEPRAIPLLIRQFQNTKGNRYLLINTLAQIGDQSVVDLLVAEYPKLNTNDKRAVLQGLLRLHSPEFRRLAAEALAINNSSLLNVATDGLYKDGSLEAEQILVEALKKEAKITRWTYICNALVNFGTPKARAALRAARSSEDSNKKSAAINALRSLQQRSPGNQYIYQARNYVTQQKWDDAIKYYNLSVEADSEFADAYSGRGVAYLNLKKYKQAKADFKRAVEVDPENTQGQTGLAILMVIEGKIEEGIKHAETTRKTLENISPNKGLLIYNTACVYGRAVEKLAASPAGKERNEKIQQYQAKAVSILKEAIANRFADFNLMKNDPDLKSLAKLPEFQKLLPNAKNNAKRQPPRL